MEVTEETFVADPERACSIVYELDRHGIEVLVDNFGTGFSSLSYLHNIHAHELKIDRSFIASMTSDRASRLIVRSITEMAQALGLRVAEGVERSE